MISLVSIPLSSVVSYLVGIIGAPPMHESIRKQEALWKDFERDVVNQQQGAMNPLSVKKKRPSSKAKHKSRKLPEEVYESQLRATEATETMVRAIRSSSQSIELRRSSQRQSSAHSKASMMSGRSSTQSIDSVSHNFVIKNKLLK